VSRDLDVCLLTTGFPRFKGDLFGSFVFELARGLHRQGLRVGVLAPHDRGAAAREEVDGILVRRFRYFLPSWQRLAYGGGMPTNLRESWGARLQVPFFLVAFWLRALGMARRSRVLHCQWTISGLVGYLVSLLIRRPVILTVRGSDFHLSKSGLGAMVNRFVYRRMASVLAVSEDLARQIGSVGVSPQRLHVVSNGVDERFHPADRGMARSELGVPAAEVMVLFVGLLVPVKGLDHLFDALQLLHDLPLTCVLVGDGPLRADLESRLAGSELEGRVVFAGRRSATEIPKWMAAADVLVLPSLSEGRPNVVLEAQACALPVVATAVGGTPELVEDGVHGLLVPPGDSNALAGSLRRLVSDEDLRRRLGASARQRIDSGGHTWDATALRTRQIYDGVLAE
jgi:glycosyltransferase involved in cell wall biosynthesis|tara:strand:- start:953 stop:2146 length:1194 start_codon:yes stop_codon:yes gene_type:complete